MNSQNTETVAQMSSLFAHRVALDIFLEIQLNKIPTRILYVIKWVQVDFKISVCVYKY